ncbi:MAG: hypothetical protein ACQES4_03940 [Bacillota bacterium]
MLNQIGSVTIEGAGVLISILLIIVLIRRKWNHACSGLASIPVILTLYALFSFSEQPGHYKLT